MNGFRCVSPSHFEGLVPRWFTATGDRNFVPTHTCGPWRASGSEDPRGRVAACADNAPMESFYSLLQKNVLDSRSWATREELHLAIVRWIEGTYHRGRRQRALGKLTPIEYETI